MGGDHRNPSSCHVGETDVGGTGKLERETGDQEASLFCFMFQVMTWGVVSLHLASLNRDICQTEPDDLRVEGIPGSSGGVWKQRCIAQIIAKCHRLGGSVGSVRVSLSRCSLRCMYGDAFASH